MGSAVCMGTYSDQIFSTPPSADDITSIDFPYLSDPSSHIPLSGTKDPRPLFIIFEASKGPSTVPPIPSVIKPNHREHLEWRPGSYGLEETRDPQERPSYPIDQYKYYCNQLLRPTTTVDRIKGGGTRIADAVRSHGASIDKVLRRCARGKYIGGSDFAGVRSITAKHLGPICMGSDKPKGVPPPLSVRGDRVLRPARVLPRV